MPSPLFVNKAASPVGKVLCGLCCLSVFTAVPAMAQSWSNVTVYEPPTENYWFWQDPSMNQSADLALLGYKSWAGLSDYWRATRFEHDEFSPLVLDVGMWVFVLPEPMVWARNEWQRDLLRQQGISAYSDAQYLYSDSENFETAVTGVTDAQLQAFRDSDPANFTRLGSARYEASQALVQNLSEDNFFNRGPGPRYRVNKGYLVLADIFSLYRCRSDEFELTQPDSELAQDITGMDCRHWAYELHADDDGLLAELEDRPRYLAYEDLSQDAQEYLDAAFYFSFLNLIDTHFFDEANGLETNRLSFQPTPFGRAFGWHHLRLQEGLNLGFDLYWQQNNEQSMPGGRLSVVDYPLGSALFTGRVAGWRQPEDLDFDATDSEAGWAVEASLSQPVFSRVRAQADWYYKTEGWYGGYSSLDSGSGWRFGVDVRVF